MTETKKSWLILAVMLYVCYCCMMWKWGHEDIYFWLDWSNYIYHNGFTRIYDSTKCNYLPAYLYIIYFHTKIQGNLRDIQDNMYTIKFYTLVFDFLGAFAAVWFVKEEYKKIFYFLLLLFNIAYIYNTAFWAQVDAIFTFWGFAAIIAALERRTVFSIVFLLIALNFKLQALVFIPVVGLLLLPQLLSKGGIKKLIIAIGCCGVLQFLILFPFIVKGRLYQVVEVITGSVDHYPFTSVGAFNLWAWLTPVKGAAPVISDAGTFGFFSYKQLGNLFFVTAVVIAVFPLMQHLYRKHIMNKFSVFPLEKIFLISSLTPLAFFFFNTQMHERYSHPALISLTAYAFCSKRFFPLILGSVAYFLNLEWIFKYMALANYNTFIFNPAFVAALYFMLILYLYGLMYTKPTDGSNYLQPDL